MKTNATYSLLAILHELNNRELRRKLAEAPEPQHYYVILSQGIVGAEISRRVSETPEAVVRDAEGFVTKLFNVATPEEGELFRGMLEKVLLDTLRGELEFKCSNCRNFNDCLDLENLEVGELFARRANGDETDGLKKEIAEQVDAALRRTPYWNSVESDRLCERFSHQYSPASIGEVFGRYADIALSLHNAFGISQREVLLKMIPLNMEFCERCPAGE